MCFYCGKAFDQLSSGLERWNWLLGVQAGERSEDIEAVLRKIEYWHQGSIADFKASVFLGQVLLCLWHICNDPEPLEHPKSVP